MDRERQQVVVERLEGGRHLITGGLLPPEMAWIPDSSDLVAIGEERYLAVGFNHASLGLLCVTPRQLRCNSFLAALAPSRKSACGEAVDKIVIEVVGATDNCAKPKLNTLRLRVLQEHSSKLPATVEVQVHMEDARVPAVFESDKRRGGVAVKCVTETLNIMEEGVVAAAQISNRKKPRLHDVFRFDFPEVKMRRQRDTPNVKFLDADGQLRYHFGRSQPKNNARARDVQLHEETIQLHELLIANHHAPADAADGGRSDPDNE